MLVINRIEIENVASHKTSTYLFENNKLNIVVGINKDNLSIDLRDLSNEEILEKSQIKLPSNGSGKSVILEAINIAIFGEAIRKGINLRDLIRKGEKSLVVTLYGQNTWLGIEELKISRTVFKEKSKVSLLSVFEKKNGLITEIKKSSIEELNKYILNYYIDLTKEDIINYFIIQKDRYNPFLQLSDSNKKDIISRFTGLAKYNFIDDELKGLIVKDDSVVNDLQKEKGKAEGTIEFINSEILALPSEESFLNKTNEEVENLKLQKQSQKDKLDIYGEKINSSKVEINEIENHELHCTARKAKFEEILSRKAFEKSYQEIEEQIQKIQDVLNNLEEILVENTKDKNKIAIAISKSKILIKGSIICPNCSYNFDPSSNKSKEELERMLSQEQLSEKDKEQIIQEINNDKKDLLKELEKQKIVKKDFEQYRRKFLKIGSIINSTLLFWNSEKRKLTRNIEEINLDMGSIAKRVNSIESSILSLQKRSYQVVLDDKSLLLQKISAKRKEIQIIDDKIDLSNALIQKHKDCQIYFNNFKNYILNKTVINISNICNIYLSQFSNLTVNILTNKMLADGKTMREELNCVVRRDGEEISYFLLSNGERCFIDLSFILTFQHIMNQSSVSGGLNYIALDEILGSLDSVSQEKLFKVLNKLNKTIDVVTFTAILSNNYKTTFIVKQNNISQVVQN